MTTLLKRHRLDLARLVLTSFVFCSTELLASFSGPTTANRMSRGIGWENLWLILLGLLFVVYPLMMSLLLFVVGKKTGIKGLLNTKTILQSYVIAVTGLIIAFAMFLVILVGAVFLFLNISPLYFYFIFLLIIGALSYRLIKETISRERNKTS